jgi:large subunit ribosomal protein L10
MNGEALDAAQITAISRLPTRDVLYGQLVGIVASPITGLARGLNGLLSGLAVALGGVLEKKESGEIGAGDAPAAAAAEEPAAEAAGAEELVAEAAAAEEPVADTTTDQDAEASEPAASSEEPAEGADDDTTEKTQEDSE